MVDARTAGTAHLGHGRDPAKDAIIIILMVIWKVIKCIIYVRLKCVLLHDALHGFRTGRSCSTGTMEVKMTQQLASLEQCPFFGIFLSLKKAYNAMTWG